MYLSTLKIHSIVLRHGEFERDTGSGFSNHAGILSVSQEKIIAPYLPGHPQ